ncbi:hypothetical protein JMA_27130 [Jeotgalibacillus malaysiensis]|uniref:Prophage pi2 protein 38 n=1 Tax=Jeotgalibacillus malaysiensis TaxID=1508404 RepID=A0A0B5AP33_9BACL|nr:hypothetical protein [Jeotgalibacillus malaysiensis]AJD92030.1 hypothetical protein JMA_27130 [Jeotgalibacillus malaysiensis]
MTLQELVLILRESGYPVAYSHFTGAAPSIPFICYVDAFSSNFKADNVVWKRGRNIQIELYTNKKDLQAESTLEGLLNANELPFEDTEVYIEEEKLFQKIYEVRLN